MTKIKVVLILTFSMLLLVVAINCEDDEAPPCGVGGRCPANTHGCLPANNTCVPCPPNLWNCNLTGTCTHPGVTAVLACAATQGKACGDASLGKTCTTTQCCDISVATTPTCRNAGEPCGTLQYCNTSSKTCVANVPCGVTPNCNPPKCCDKSVDTAGRCVAALQACDTDGQTCKSTGTCSGSGTGIACGSTTCKAGECCDNNTKCVPSGSQCLLQGGTCSSGKCSTTGGACTEGQDDSCKSDVQHCVGTICNSCSGTAKNCDRSDTNDCECPNGCNPQSPKSCAESTGTTTKCPSYGTSATGFVTCITASQICVIFSDTGGENYECKNVPSECLANRNCLCLKSTTADPCQSWPTCDDYGDNTITCQE